MTCLAAAAVAGQPFTWNRNRMSLPATMCNIHTTWLTLVAMRALAGIHHAGDLDRLVEQLAVGAAARRRTCGCQRCHVVTGPVLLEYSRGRAMGTGTPA